MPSSKNPGTIKSGSGKASSAPVDKLALVGGGMVATPPNIGQPGYFPPDSTSPVPGALEPSGEGGGGLKAHVDAPTNAHPATAISASIPTLFSHNVQGVLQELAGGVAEPPPMLGESKANMSFTGIPDWGALKLRDGPIMDPDTYPYKYHYQYDQTSAPAPTVYFPEFPTPTGDWVNPLWQDAPTNLFYTYSPSPNLINNGYDPTPDVLWNGGFGGFSGSNPIEKVYGSGGGEAKAGAYTRPSDSHVVRSRALPWKTDGVDGYVSAVTISGTLYPADRGVFAIIHWPANGNVNDFLAQDPLDRVVAAILLGVGAGNGCLTKDTDPLVGCDGSPGYGPDSGSIFSVGVDNDGNYDPMAYPGQATGQYDLHEIATGYSDYVLDSSDTKIVTQLPGTWGNGWKKSSFGPVGAGQVRWGTETTVDPSLPVLEWGIPILGAGPDSYDGGGPGSTVDVIDPANGYSVDTVTCWGQSLILPTNFFGYRLPYLKDYSYTTGLKYTPKGLATHGTRESVRYFVIQDGNVVPWPVVPVKLQPYVTSYLKNKRLRQAGNYPDFAEDNWDWQVARYRHTFFIPGSDGRGEECGSYWAIHFKKEGDFEAFVRDGIMPWDVTNGYEVYGALPADTTDIGSVGNLLSTVTDFTGPAGTGPTSNNYPAAAKSYHVLRSNIVTSDNAEYAGPLSPVSVDFATYSWDVDPAFEVEWVSGVAYFLPQDSGGTPLFFINDLDIKVDDAFVDFYRTDDNIFTGDNPPQDPPVLSSPCPAYLSLAQFTTHDMPVPGTDMDDSVFGHLANRPQRFEIPYNYLGGYSETAGPTNGDSLIINGLGAFGQINLPEDSFAFSSDASLRLFIRRPFDLVDMDPPEGIKLDTTGAVATAKILYHGAVNAGATTEFGNFVVSPGGPYPTLAKLGTDKDSEENFLDESYRYIANIGAAGGSYASPLTGPGLGTWRNGPIPTPTQIGKTTDAYWRLLSFAQYEKFKTSLTTLTTELQVVGLPDRNPVGSSALRPSPKTGLLMYPQKDYSTGYVPDLANYGITQPDYSGIPGAGGERVFIRCFDVAFANSYKENAANQPFFYVRIDGLTLADFAYKAPGPGGLAADSGIAIMVKVPGLTTWMDLGRVDGDGPSKQDRFSDGAGCQVVGPTTFSKDSKTSRLDPETGMVYCQVKVNVGPFANLAKGQLATSGEYEVPVLFKIIMNEKAVGYNLEGENTGLGTFDPPDPNADAAKVRGLCKIRILPSFDVDQVVFPPTP